MNPSENMPKDPNGSPETGMSENPSSEITAAAPQPIANGEVAPPKKAGLSWATAFFLIFVAMALLAWGVVSLLVKLPGGAVDKTAEMAGKARDAVVDVFNLQPKVVSRTKVHYEQSSPALELSVTRRETLVEHETDHQYLGSTKRLRLRGVYEVKSGFDLDEPFTATIDGTVIELILPPAKILSVEQKTVEVLELRNGLWNKITPGDVEDHVNTLSALARQRVWKAGINDEAEKAVVEKLKEKLGPDTIIQINRDSLKPREFPKG